MASMRPSNNRARGSRGGRCMIPCSLASASNTIEQAGSMTNSRNTMCTGKSSKGHPKTSGSSDMPAVGTWTAMMYRIAFRMFS
jgi:hypothetical protein